jgi:hypothetical protein
MQQGMAAENCQSFAHNTFLGDWTSVQCACHAWEVTEPFSYAHCR